MQYCLGAEGGDPPVSVTLSALWRVNEDSKYHCRFPDGYPATFVAVRTVGGCGYLEDASSVFTLDAGTLAILPPRTVRAYGTRGDCWDFYWFEFLGPRWLPRTFARPEAAPLEEELLRRVERELSHRRQGMASAAFSLLMQIWLAGEEAEDPITEAARRIDLGAADPDFSLSALPAQFHISERTLRDRFCRRFGCTPFAYLDRKRLDIALYLLRNTDMTGSAIAGRAGFSSEFYFSRWFKERCGFSPTAWRASSRR